MVLLSGLGRYRMARNSTYLLTDWRWALLLAFSVIAAVAAVAAQPAGAHGVAPNSNSTACNVINRLDTNISTINYKQAWMTDENRLASQWNMNTRINPTDLWSSPTTSWAAPVVFMDDDYTNYCGRPWWTAVGGGTIGHTRCSTDGSNGCFKHHIRVTTTWTEHPVGTQTKVRALMCHEVGHILFSKHSGHSTVNGCHRWNGVSNSWTWYTTHEINLINSGW